MATDKIRGFEVVADEQRQTTGEVMLPTRGSAGSAGYDFYSTKAVEIPPGGKELFWTDVKAYMQKGEVLLLTVRSSVGNKRDLMMANTTGVIDEDYYSNPENDGNIGIMLRNLSDKPQFIDLHERIAQGIFVPYLVADNGNSEAERAGGFGSTGK